MAKLSDNWITRVMRLAIYMRDRFTCVYCCRDLHAAEPFTITLDHIKPRNAGGKHTPKNLVTACRSCNSSKKHHRDWINKRQQKRVDRQIAKPLPMLAAERIIFGDEDE
jgi:5-methylcytosine-specific restriction endonuclease McrA